MNFIGNPFYHVKNLLKNNKPESWESGSKTNPYSHSSERKNHNLNGFNPGLLWELSSKHDFDQFLKISHENLKRYSTVKAIYYIRRWIALR